MQNSTNGRPPYVIESVENALKILLTLRNAREIRVSEVAADLSIARSSAHRLLATLTYLGFLRHDHIKRLYVPGTVLVEIASASTNHTQLRRAAMPHVERLAADIEWTVHLSVLEGTDIRFVDGAESTRPVRVTARVGSRFPAHSTSSGKVLLSELPLKHLRSLYGPEIPQVTEHTVATLDDLLVELERVAEDGYATNAGENEVGLYAISVPLRTKREGTIAAIAAACPSTAVEDQIVPSVLAKLRRTAALIMADLDDI
jgi:DNA-binding IclR family transcriptional regulator